MVVFGDELGLPTLIEVLPAEALRGMVVAGNRPQAVDAAARLAGKCSVPLLSQPYRNEAGYEDFLSGLKNFSSQLFVVYSYSMILGPDLLSIPPEGVVNLHAGLLPSYRGANVLNWVLVNGEKETGITLHYMDERVDSGDIISQKHVPVGFEDTAVTLRARLVTAARELMTEQVPRILSGTNLRITQDETKARYWKRRTPEDGRIDWNWPVERIYNLIRALVKPWPGAYYLDASGQKNIIDYFLSVDNVKVAREKILREQDSCHTSA